MARVAVSVTLGGNLGNGTFNVSKGRVASIAAALVTAVDDAMAVLQADAASPTEAHVDTADTAWIAAKAAVTASQTPNLVLEYDNAVITTKNALRAALRAAVDAAIESGLPD